MQSSDRKLLLLLYIIYFGVLEDIYNTIIIGALIVCRIPYTREFEKRLQSSNRSSLAESLANSLEAFSQSAKKSAKPLGACTV